MARTSLQLNLPPSLVKSVDSAASIGCQDEVNSVDVAGSLRAAVEDCGQHKEAAISTGCGKETWSRVLKCERGIRLDQLGHLPADVQRAFLTRWGRQLHMDIRESDVKQQALADLAECAVRALRVIA